IFSMSARKTKEAEKRKVAPAEDSTIEEEADAAIEVGGEEEVAEGRETWDAEGEEMEEEGQPQKKKVMKTPKHVQNEEEDECEELADRPRLTIDMACAQMKREEMCIRQFIDELKSKKRHLQVEEERLRHALNQKLAQETGIEEDEEMSEGI
ncbi:hypothetical protein PFISCL1PPCAC_22131, partial [Pristionchus fissidentatus]